MKKKFKSKVKSLVVYGSPGNQFGDTMVGGNDVININKMMEDAFSSGSAGVGDSVVKIGNYKGHNVFEQKAADQIRISMDDNGNAYVKLIVRKLDPGRGLIALAGGFKDTGESDQQAADREEKEEAKSDTGRLIILHQIDRHPVRGDVRIWGGPDRDDGVKNGDIIAMSTVGMVPVVSNAHTFVEAGDDASGAGWIKLSDIADSNVFGIKGHAVMLLQAASLAGVDTQLPSSYTKSLNTRTEDILIGSSDLQAKANNIVGKQNTPKKDPNNKLKNQ
jgi:ADP-ribose pyrophosphatase YjhB (NUDIX family)